MMSPGIWARGVSYLALAFLLIVEHSTFVMVDGVELCYGGGKGIKFCKWNQLAYCFYADCPDGNHFIASCAPYGATNREAACEYAKEVCSTEGFGSGALESCYVCNSGDGCNNPNYPLDDMPNPPITDTSTSVLKNDKPETPKKEEKNGVGKNEMSAILVSSGIFIALMLKQLLDY